MRRSQVIRTIVFWLPGVLLVAGGRNTPLAAPVGARTWYLLVIVYEKVYPDDWVSLCICAVLLCAPGALMYVGADYLAELPSDGFPPRPAPAVLWRALGYLWAIGGATIALFRLVGE